MSIIKEPVKIIGTKGEKIVNALIDTGASTTFIREDLADKIGAIKRKTSSEVDIGNGTKMDAVDGAALIEVRKCLVGTAGKIVKNCPEQLVIGVDFLQRFKANIDLKNDKLKVTCPRERHFLI